MKTMKLFALGMTALAVWLGAALWLKAQEKSPAQAQRHEFAVIKWDGTDKVCVYLPTKSEILRVFDLSNTRTPREMQDEEYCLAWMANKLAKEGWDVAGFDSRRLVFRRAMGQ
jgi:hypothetical protein